MKPYVLVCDVGDGHMRSVLTQALSRIPDLPMIITEYQPAPTLSAMCLSISLTNSCPFDLDRAMQAWERCKKWVEFLNRLAPVNLEPNPLVILSRALNARLPLRASFVPRWKRGRWKAKS